MESSHRRLICDMEEKHKLEIERLLAEKETALAEETQVGKDTNICHIKNINIQTLCPS